MAAAHPFVFPDLTPQQGAEVTRLIGEIDDFKGHWRRVTEIRAEKLAGLRYVSTIESTASSTRIEGARLSDDDVERVLQGLTIDSFLERDVEEVRGYGELLQTIYDGSEVMALTENHIKQLHGIALKYSAKDERHRGDYKKLPNDVVARHPDGRTEIIFRTATPFDTPRLMAELIAGTNASFEEGDLHRLIVIARFIVEFLAIHPFQDGNGRLSRAITALLLLRSGYLYVPYASLERIVEDNKADYYAALRVSQLAMADRPSEYREWLLFFLRALVAQKRALETKLSVERGVLDLSADQGRVLDFITKNGSVKSSQIGDQLAIPYRTVRYHLGSLISRGLVAAHGAKRGAFYTRAVAPAGPLRPASVEGGTNEVIAEVYLRGGKISRRDLVALVKEHGFDPRTVGVLHGRRVAHLRKDPRTGQSVLTSRGEEVARQVVLSRRLRGPKA